MKALRCTGCGANLNPAKDDINAKCEYCDTIVRVAASDELQITTRMIDQIDSIVERGRSKELNNKYEQIKDLIGRHAYVSASAMLNEVLEIDYKQPRAWFYKSKLPIIEQESVLYHGVYINVKIIASLTKRDQINEYLKSCGLPWYRHRGFMRYYGSKNFLYEQQLKFIDKAIDYSSPDWIEAMKDEKQKMMERQQRKLRRRAFGYFFVGILCFAFGIVGLIILRSTLEELVSRFFP